MESLLDRKLNPNFKAPSLHACLTSTIPQLMNYTESENTTPSSSSIIASSPVMASSSNSSPTSCSSSCSYTGPATGSGRHRGGFGRAGDASGLQLAGAGGAMLGGGSEAAGAVASSAANAVPSSAAGGGNGAPANAASKSVTRQSAAYANFQMIVNYNKHRAPNTARRQRVRPIAALFLRI